MKVAAIIAEYNPFHNGHKYLIEETRKQTGADYILAVMSGDFVQRGTPALCNKYIRTEMALQCGVDAVIELPAFYALSSAEFFATGSIAILNALGIVDTLSFGSESGNLPLLFSSAQNICQNILLRKDDMKALLKEGYSYPVACAKIFHQPNTASEDVFSSPNNILGLEYCKALIFSQSRITPFTIKRSGNGYHTETLSADASVYGSASAIRNALEKSSNFSAIQDHVPDAVFSFIEQNHMANTYLKADDFSSLLHYKLLSEQKDGFSRYLDCTPDLSDKICKYLPEYTTLSDFIAKIKSKDLTYTRISRTLFHILLNITYPDWYEDFASNHKLTVPYARLLGFRTDALPLLTAIRKNSSIPLLSKLADASNYLDTKGIRQLEQDIFCASVYETVRFHKTGIPAINEFRQSPIKIS